jgi:hypothetical protein
MEELSLARSLTAIEDQRKQVNMASGENAGDLRHATKLCI